MMRIKGKHGATLLLLRIFNTICFFVSIFNTVQLMPVWVFEQGRD